MKKFISIIVLSLTLFSSKSYALGLKDYISGRNTDLSDALILTMGQSFEIANAVLEHQKRDPLYCTPRKLPISGKQYDEILMRYVGNEDIEGNKSTEILLLFALMDVFPCH